MNAPNFFVNLLDRYIFKSVLLTCIGAVALFAFVLMLGNALKELLEPVLAGQLPLDSTLRLVLLLVPFVISYALPLGMLTGVLLTLGRLSADSEITAMRAAGMSLSRIARPVLLLGALGLALALYVNFESMPFSRVEYHRQFAAAMRSNPVGFIVPKTPITRFSGVIIYVGEKEYVSEKEGTVLRDFWLWKLDKVGRVQQFVRAETGSIAFDEASSELVLYLTRAVVESRDEKSPESFAEDVPIGISEKMGPFRLSIDRIFGRDTREQRLDWMTYRQLLAEQARVSAEAFTPETAKDHARTVMKVKLTVQDKINTALAVFSFALVGVPLGIRVSRRETSANLGVAVMLALGYYFLTVMVGWLDRHPEYRPDLLLWIPNLAFIGLGLWLFARIDRR
ncbi:MAG: LptF/LptG family permease [Opitutaceae bacterium]